MKRVRSTLSARRSVSARDVVAVRQLPRWLVGVACVAGGILTWGAGVSPTGDRAFDLVVVGAASAGVTLLASMAPWWAVAAAGLLAGVLAAGPIGLALGCGAFAISLARSARRLTHPVWALLAALLVVQAMAWLARGPWFGASSALAFALLSVPVISPSRRWSAGTKRRATALLGGLVAVSLFAVLGLAASSASAKPLFVDGNETLQRAFEELSAGDAVAASKEFDAASLIFARIAQELDQPWSRPSRLIPVVAQHTRGIQDLSAGAAALCHDLSVSLERIDPASLRLSNGTVDLAFLPELDAPLGAAEASLRDFSALVDRVRSPWLFDLVQDSLADADRELVRSIDAVANLRQVLEILPAMLGADGTRRYFVGFVTPAEARGGGGFMGNYAELTASGGRLEMTKFGRVSDLTEAADLSDFTFDVGSEFVERYGAFGFAEGPQRRVRSDIWSVLTMSPDVPTVARLIEQLYPASGGAPIDGVLIVDPAAMAALVELTGPVPLPGLAEPLSAADTEAYILRGQYDVADKADRLDALEVLARTVIERLLGGDMPGPWKLARLLAPVLARDGLAFWSGDDNEQMVLQRLGATGEMPALDGHDGLAVVVNNGGGNKIDSYLHQRVTYDVLYDRTTSMFSSTASIELRNDAPADGAPAYVIRNANRDPAGTNRMYLSVYSGLAVRSAQLEGEPIAVERGTEVGWNVSSLFAVIPPGETRTLNLTFVGPAPGGSYSFLWHPTPAANGADVEVTIRDVSGRLLSNWAKQSARRDKVLTVS